jgi:hypothetical protein
MSRKKYAPRIRLTQDEAEVISQYRAIKKASDEIGVNDKDVKHGWLKSKDASLFFKNPNFKTEESQQYELLRNELLEQVKNYSPKYPTLKRFKNSEGHLLIVDPADIHIGKLCNAFETGEEYNQQIAVKRVLEGVEGIIQKSSGWNIDQVVFVAGNDVLHTDTPRRTTTSGTPQDTDGMWYENFMTATKLYIQVIERLMTIADVHIMYDPSNHDYTNGFFLAQVIKAHFSQSKNITFDVSISHRKYFVYGLNLIGTTHGDGAKAQDLPMLMAQESEHWGTTKHRYWYTKHLHHKVSKDYHGVCVETLRSPSGTDSWHHRNGYQHAQKAIEGFIHCKQFGQIARLTHIF